MSSPYARGDNGQQSHSGAAQNIRLTLNGLTDMPATLGAGAYLFAVPNVARVLKREVLRSPYIPRNGEPLFRPDKGSARWAAANPDKRPGAWAQRHVEMPADALSAKREECRRRRDAAIDGLLSNFGCVDHNDLDRLATSAALEAA
jgi:hypothetical protein